MFCKKFCVILLCVNLVSSLRLHTNSRLSGFVLVDNNFTYVEELVPSQIDIAANPTSGSGGEKLQDAYNPNERDVVTPAKAYVRFDPPILYFKDKVVGNSYRETVYIFNTSQNKTLRMEKIAGGKHSQIQIASFGDELVTPGGNTTFDIIFIGKDLVPLSTHYYIYTSKGILKYDVVSWCLENPFRITPMSSITLPLNSSYSHSITIRNPFPEPLQITEALLHGGDYTSHALPPNIDFEHAIESWTIRPYETKEILRVHFLTYEAWNLTTFQSIKLGTGTTLLIPVEVEVIPRTGLYVLGSKIDFESGGHLDPPAVRPLHLCSSAKKTVTIENISCESRIDGCEVVDFRPTALPPWSCAVNPVAKVKFVWNAKTPGEIINGGLLIKNDLDPYFKVNYTARIHHGGLTYNSSLTHYVTGIPSCNSSPRPFAFTNEYRELVAVMNVYLSFEAAEYFHIRGFEPSVLKPQEKRVLFSLQTRKGVRLSELKLDGSILLETNISTIRLPLRVYDGLLTQLSKVSPFALNLGLVGSRSTVVTHFGVANNNPETIFVKYFGCNDTSVKVELLDVKPGNAKTFYFRSFKTNESGIQHSGGFNIHPYHYASFKVSVNTSDVEEEVFAQVWVQTEYERMVLPMYMNVAKGYIRVSPDPFEFEDCFPGAYCVQQLTVESHFMRSMSIVNISTIPYTSYDKLVFLPNMPAVIAGHATSIVGNILWEPTIDPSQAWPLGYLGLPNNRTGRDRWLGTIERPNITRDFDLTLIESQYLRYREQFSTPIDLLFRLDTTEVRNFLFRGRIQLQWPQIVSTRVIDFPLAQIGTVTYENITVFNPMHSHYMTVQAILAYHYQQEIPTVIGTMISEFEEPGGVESKSNEFFLDMNYNSPFKESVLNGTKRKFTNHKSSIVFILPPQANATIRVGFTPSSQILTTTRLYLRNDLTILDAIAINGAGAYPQLTLEGLDQSAGNLIKFVIPYETLRLCEENNNKVLNITTKKVFRLRNTGQVSVHIYGFTINGLPCQGYGFKITNCHNAPFVLKPGMSKRIEIYFSPDFTSARIESTLQVESDMKMGPMLSYTLYAALDSDWLRKCKPHLQRPYWEPLVYYLMIGMFFFLLIGVAIMAVYEVSTHTSRLINGFGGVEEKVQPFYDLKLIELFFVRSSVPHHHHHNHHHHSNRSAANSSTGSAPSTKSEVTSQGSAAVKDSECRNGSLANGHAVCDREHLVHRTSAHTNNDRRALSPLLALRTSPSAQSAPRSPTMPFAAGAPFVSAAISSSQTFVYSSCSSSNNSSNNSSSSSHCSSSNTSNNHNSSNHAKSNSITSSCEVVKLTPAGGAGGEKRGHNASGQQSSNSNSPTNGAEESSNSRLKKGKKFNFEDVCHKSNWFKRQAKKEEKSSGNKFLKNGWARCLKCGSSRKDAKSSDDKRCACLEKSSTVPTVETTPPSRKDGPASEVCAANTSSHSNNANTTNSKYTKETPQTPRQLEINKSSKKTSSPGETVSETSPATNATTEAEETVVAGAKTPDTSSTSTKSKKQKKKKAIEVTTKFSETTTKENIKENVATFDFKPVEKPKKSAKEEARNGLQSNDRKQHNQSKGGDTSEALKPITNLPKSKEPFETLSSLCNESVSLKNKRKSNAKKRTKEEKFVNLGRELSIVFTTPETIDRKSAKKSNASEPGRSEKAAKQSFAPSQQPSSTLEEQQNKINRQRNMTHFHNHLNHHHPHLQYPNASNRIISDENLVFPEPSANLTNYYNHTAAELYSRVVAPPATSRSSSSSSSSESTASYESTAGMSTKFMEHRPGPNNIWDSWSNDLLFQNGVMPMNNFYSNSVFVDDKNETTNHRLKSTSEVPDFVLVRENNQNFLPNLFCNSSYSPKNEEYDVNSDDAEDTELYNFARTNLSDEEELVTASAEPPPLSKPVVNDIWGPPTSLFSWTPSDLSGSPSNLTSDAVSAISLSRLLRFEEKKEKDIEQFRPLSSLWSADTKSIWGHPKQE